MRLSELVAYAEEKYGIREEFKWAEFPGFSVLPDPNTSLWAAVLMRQTDPQTGQETETCDIRCGQAFLNFAGRSAPYLSQPFRMTGRQWVGVTFDETTSRNVVHLLLDTALFRGKRDRMTIVLGADRRTRPAEEDEYYTDTPLPFGRPPQRAEKPEVPAKIAEMKKLGRSWHVSQAEKAKDFVRQGKFMEDYEDDSEWNGEFHHFYPAYGDLPLKQLRGYFGWRTRLRKGEYRPIAASLAYIYVYELLCGIGTASPAESMEKLEQFQARFVDSGIGDPSMRRNLRRWMYEYAIMHGMPRDTICRYADPETVEEDTILGILKEPASRTDEEIFSALCHFGHKTFPRSPVVTGDPVRGKHLFAELWRLMSDRCRINSRRIFAACFGPQRSDRWHPLFSALYWEEEPVRNADFILNECRSYHCRNGDWTEKRFESRRFKTKLLFAILREADRLFRRELKTGRYLDPKDENGWVVPYAQEVIDAERKARAEAAKPKITISLSELEHIRRDAEMTRDRLLTEEEASAEAAAAPRTEKAIPEEAPPKEETENAAPARDGIRGLDAVHAGILGALCEGRPIGELIGAGHLIASVVADTINEALFDEVGDNVLECDGNDIAVIEDYREDLKRILRG